LGPGRHEDNDRGGEPSRGKAQAFGAKDEGKIFLNLRRSNIKKAVKAEKIYKHGRLKSIC
jgi:hypothetical protein